MTITELAIKRPSFIIVIFACLTVGGIFSYTLLKYELLPKITPPVMTVSTIYAGASPSEVEYSVTKIIEESVSGLNKISEIRSYSMEGLSLVTVEFHQDADLDISLQDAQRKIGEILSKLPTGAKNPTLSRFSTDETPVLRIGLTSSLAPREFYQFLKDRIQPQLSKIPGVGQVIFVGGEEREIRVNVDPQRLRTYGISIQQVTQALKNSNLDFPTGKIKGADNQYVLRIAGKLTTLDQLRELSIATSRQGSIVQLSDLADVLDTSKEQVSFSRVNGKPSVGLLIMKQSDANAVEVSKFTRAAIKQLEITYEYVGLNFEVAFDGSTYTLDAAGAVIHDLGIAIVLVAIVMFLFLHSLRNSIIVMVAIPASLVSTFIAMYFLDFSLNLMTLLGMSLVIGILVDDSIVVLENIYHHLEKGKDPRTAALHGRNEIGFAALSITLVDCAVFIPLMLTTGLVGNIMRSFAAVVVLSTLMSLFVSFTVTPMLASRFTKLEHLNPRSLLGKIGFGFEKIYHWVSENYSHILAWSLNHRIVIGLISILLLVASIALVPMGFIGNEFITQSDRGQFAITIELAQGSTLEKTDSVTREVEKILKDFPEVIRTFVTVGSSTDGHASLANPNVAEINVTLTPKQDRVRSTMDIGRAVRKQASNLTGVKLRVNPIGIFGTATGTPIQIVVNGTNYQEVEQAANHVANLLKKIPGTADVRTSTEEGKPETQVLMDRREMSILGLTIAEVGAALRTAFQGDDESKYRDGSNEYDIRVVLNDFDRTKTTDVENLAFINKKGQLVELKQFSSILQTVGPTRLQRQDRSPAVTIFSQVAGRPSGTIGKEFMQALKENPLPKGIGIAYLADLRNQQQGFGSMGLALLAGILFVYLIMVALYDSFVYPFVVLFSIPLALIGALLALALSMRTLSIFSILGIIMLVGLVAKNAILLVDRANQMRIENGMNAVEALMEAGRSRLRPILMTTFAMVIGMLPIALNAAAGSEWKSGLSWALIGGLISSLLLTLVLVPVVYLTVSNLLVRIPILYHRLLDFISKSNPTELHAMAGTQSTIALAPPAATSPASTSAIAISPLSASIQNPPSLAPTSASENKN